MAIFGSSKGSTIISIKALFILPILLSSIVWACDDKEKPLIEVLVYGIPPSQQSCESFVFSLPKEYRGARLNNVRVEYGSGKDKIEFNLAIINRYEDESKSMAAICTNEDWLAKVKLRVDYIPVLEDGSASLCLNSYFYENLYPTGKFQLDP